MVEVGVERSDSRGHGGGVTRVVRLELMWWGRRQAFWFERMWWRCDMSGCARIDIVRVGDERSGSRVYGGGGT